MSSNAKTFQSLRTSKINNYLKKTHYIIQSMIKIQYKKNMSC